MKLYTRKGDDGTTGLLYGGRVPKDSPAIEATGAVDEAQAVIGLARAETERGSELDELLVGVERDLWVLMAELTTATANRSKLTAGATLVTPEMVAGLEQSCDALGERFAMPTEFVIPGQNRAAALLDVARTVVRRAERLTIAAVPSRQAEQTEQTEQAEEAGQTEQREQREQAEPESHAVAYLNRLSTLMWVMARSQEGTESLPARTVT